MVFHQFYSKLGVLDHDLSRGTGYWLFKQNHKKKKLKAMYNFGHLLFLILNKSFSCDFLSLIIFSYFSLIHFLPINENDNDKIQNFRILTSDAKTKLSLFLFATQIMFWGKLCCVQVFFFWFVCFSLIKWIKHHQNIDFIIQYYQLLYKNRENQKKTNLMVYCIFPNQKNKNCNNQISPSSSSSRNSST